MTLPYRLAFAAAFLAAFWWWGYQTRDKAAETDMAALRAVAAAESDRYRKLEQEVSDAQAAHLTTWRAARSDADAAWLRLRQERAGRVPAVPSQCGSAPADPPSAVAGSGDLLAALEAGERLQATLTLCQTELRQCAEMR